RAARKPLLAALTKPSRLGSRMTRRRSPIAPAACSSTVAVASVLAPSTTMISYDRLVAFRTATRHEASELARFTVGMTIDRSNIVFHSLICGAGFPACPEPGRRACFPLELQAGKPAPQQGFQEYNRNTGTPAARSGSDCFQNWSWYVSVLSTTGGTRFPARILALACSSDCTGRSR